MRNITCWLLFVAALSSAAIGCDHDENVPPDSGVRTDAGGNVEDAGDPDAGVDPCAGEDGCYACEATTEPQIVNACTDTQCEPFDNDARLPRYDGPTLPPLP